MKQSLRILLLTASVTTLLFFTGDTLSAQLLTTPSADAEALVTSLIGEGVIVSDITMDCPSVASGFFTCADCNVGLDSGILLTSGTPGNAEGPNNSGSLGTDNFAPGDADLDDIPGVFG